MDKNKRKRLILMLAGGAAALTLTVLSTYSIWERPPETDAGPKTLADAAQGTPAPRRSAAPSPSAERDTAFRTERQDGVYTFLFAGSDDGTGNTDVIMVGRLDTVRHNANFVSIPRDTLINVDTPIRKLNAVYWGAVNNGGSGAEALLRQVKKLTGFEADCYAVISLEGFERAIDALGGIWFDVPRRMYYDQGPVIDLQPGYQLLNGEQAMWLCRYRSGYVNGDLDRIEMQHDFLRAAAEQFLSLGSIPNIPLVAGILADSMDTNMTASNMAWFARQLLRCKSEDIRFLTAPNTPAFVRDLSYTFLDLYNWLQMINEDLNPGAAPIGEGQLDLVYLRSGEVCCTTALRGVSYFELGRQRKEPEAEPAPLSIPEDYVPPTPARPRPAPSTAPAEDWLTESTPEAAAPPAPVPTPAPEPAPSALPLETVPPFLLTPDDWLSETLAGSG